MKIKKTGQNKFPFNKHLLTFKATFFSLAILLTFYITSCKKNSNNITNETEAVLGSKTILELRQSYKLLSVQAKEALWNKKFNTILVNDKNKLTTKQYKIVVMVKDFMNSKTIQSLINNPKDGEVFVKSNLEYFYQNFTPQELYLLIECPYYCNDFSILKSGEYLDKLIKAGYQSKTAPIYPSNCSCYYTIYCQATNGGTGSCIDGGCNTVSECGLFGTSNCSGSCK